MMTNSRVPHSRAVAHLAQSALIEIRLMAGKRAAMSTSQVAVSEDVFNQIRLLADIAHGLPGVLETANRRARERVCANQLRWIYESTTTLGRDWILQKLEDVGYDGFWLLTGGRQAEGGGNLR